MSSPGSIGALMAPHAAMVAQGEDKPSHAHTGRGQAIAPPISDGSIMCWMKVDKVVLA